MSQAQDNEFSVPLLRARIAAGVFDFLLVLAVTLYLSDGYLGFPLLFVLYHTGCVWLTERTAGKALLGLRVLRSRRGPTLLWSLGRSSLGLFLVNGFGLGFLASLLDRRGRAVHDFVFGSVVVIEDAQLGLKWSARVRDWLKLKNETLARKTELVATASGVWNFVVWINRKIEQFFDLIHDGFSLLEAGGKSLSTASIPAAPTLTAASISGVAATVVTGTLLAVVPGAVQIAAYIASPVYRFARPADTGVVTAVQAPGGLATHTGINGSPVLVKAVVDSRPGETLSYRVDFGDGSDAATGEVQGSFVSVSHRYRADDPGLSYMARVRVMDSDGDTVGRGDYAVDFVDFTDEQRAVEALDDALWALNVSQVRESPPGSGSIGHWEYSPEVGVTALAALAFEVNGFDAGVGEASPYRDTVDRALRYVLSRSTTAPIPASAPARDPDSNGNGFGIALQYDAQVMYELPMVVMALVASGEPSRLADSGPAGVNGRRYDDIVRDMIDYIAFAQVDAPSDDQFKDLSDGQLAQLSNFRGGWRYRANPLDADMSVTQWPVLAMMAAEEWGIEAPDWVRTELGDHFLTAVQDDATGQFYYEPGGATGVGMTAAGLLALRFTGVPASDDRVQRAVAYIGQNWETGNTERFYYMYALMKAARLLDPPVREFGGRDWFAEYAADLTGSQNEDGTWPVRDSYGSGILATVWPSLILSRDIFATGLRTELRRRFADMF